MLLRYMALSASGAKTDEVNLPYDNMMDSHKDLRINLELNL